MAECHSSKNIYSKRGVNEEKLVITGRPIWDKLVNYNNSKPKKEIISEYNTMDEVNDES